MIPLCMPKLTIIIIKKFYFFSLYSIKNKYKTIIKKIHEAIVIIQSQQYDC